MLHAHFFRPANKSTAVVAKTTPPTAKSVAVVASSLARKLLHLYTIALCKSLPYIHQYNNISASMKLVI
jgi:hypothetical protein